jgi:hypothetical protein
LAIVLTSCDPAIFFFEKPSNVSLRFQGDGEIQVRYWEEGGIAPEGDQAVLAVAAALFPNARLSEPFRDDAVNVVDVSGEWDSREPQTLTIDGPRVYEAVLATTGQRRQGIGYCMPLGVRSEVSSDHPAYDLHSGCGVWSADSASNAPTISLSTRPATREAMTTLAAMLAGVLSGALMLTFLVRRRRLALARAIFLAAVPLAALVVGGIFGGSLQAVQAFRLAGIPFPTQVGSILVIGSLASAVVSVIFLVINNDSSRKARVSVPGRPDI